jgi:hypothetical protein
MTTMSANPETPDTRYKLREPIPGILLEDDLSAIPKEVEAANAKAVAAWDGHRTALVQLRSARDEQNLAPHLDAIAGASAIAAGKELPTERAQNATSEAVTLCARREQGARTLARDAQLELAYAINKHRVVWTGEQSAVCTVARDECLDLVRQLGVALDALTRERVLLDGLKDFPQGGALDYTRMGRINAPVMAPSADLQAIREAINPTTQGNTLASNSAPTSRRVLGQQ